MTCIVAKRFGGPNQNHFALRREAAAAIVRACHLFGNDYTTLKARVLRTLCDAIHPPGAASTAGSSSLASRYGATVALAMFGAKAVDAFLLPNLWETWREWEDDLSSSTATSSSTKRFEIQMCQRATLYALGVWFRDTTPDEKAVRLDWDDVEGTLADMWVALSGQPTEYTTCIV